MNDEIISILERKDVQVTPMRMLVLEQFLLHACALSLADLEAALQRSDRSTIYRSLKTFVEKGVLHTVEEGSVAQHYALCQDACRAGEHRDWHPHFYCENCGQTTCIQELIIPRLTMPSNYQVHELEMTVKGRCPSCLKN